MANKNSGNGGEFDDELLEQDTPPSDRKKKKPFFSKKNGIVLGGVGVMLVGSVIYGMSVDMPSSSVSLSGESSSFLPAPNSESLPKALPTDKPLVTNESVIGKTMAQKRNEELKAATETGDAFLDSLITPDNTVTTNFEHIDEQKADLKAPAKTVANQKDSPAVEPQKTAAPTVSEDRAIDANSSVRLNNILQTIGTTGGENPYSKALSALDKSGAPKTIPEIVEFADPEKYSDYDANSQYHIIQNGQLVSTSAGSGEESLPLFKVALGTRFYGMPEIMLVSDDKGPAIAKIYEGPLKGAILAGTYTLNELSEGINIKLDRMSYNGRQYAVEAVMLNLESGRPVMADDVDNHYFKRYGAVGLAAMVSGFASTLKTTTQVVGSDGGVTVVENPIDKGKDQFIYALGQVGSVWANELTKNINRPITVTTYAGTGAQIMFMNDVEIY